MKNSIFLVLFALSFVACTPTVVGPDATVSLEASVSALGDVQVGDSGPEASDAPEGGLRALDVVTGDAGTDSGH